MLKHIWLNSFIFLCGLFLAPSAISHPFDAPLSFRKHTTNDGRIIYSNIQKKCFSDGLLLCTHLHPVFGGQKSEQSTIKTDLKEKPF